MRISEKATVELFHLAFLRHFHQQIDPKLYAIKGGGNLRFFFDSQRYSEDLDIDVQTIQPLTLQQKVQKILSSTPLSQILKTYGIEQINSSAPKQTDTTQRWKLQLHHQHFSLPLVTKIEFSRRNQVMDAELGNVSLSVCQQYRLSPLRLSHYPLAQALQQKILALAHRTQVQARDVFDIYHLLHMDQAPILTLNAVDIDKAKEALYSVSYSDYTAQVVSFLEPEQQRNMRGIDYWSHMTEVVLAHLER